MTTCAAVSGADYPQTFQGHDITPMEGVSLVPLLTGSAPVGKPDRFLYWEHEGNAAVRQGDWKLVRVGRNGPWELYDIATDRTELRDLATIHPERVTALAEKWEAWALRTNVKPYPVAGGKNTD